MLNGAAPGFDIQGGLLLGLARCAWLAVLLSAFGALVFQLAVAPHAWQRMPPKAAASIARRVDRVVRGSLVAALAVGAVWLVLGARGMADAVTLPQTLAAVPVVLLHTAFGHLVALQLVAVAAALLATRRALAAVACGLATALQAWHGHAAAMGDAWLLLAGIVHLVSAGAWLGGLLPLLIVVRAAPAKAAATAARFFSPMGKLCVAGLAASASVQGWVLVGSIPGLAGTAYGWVVLLKLALFGGLLGFAAVNRYRLAPALLGGDPASARHRLVRSIAVQTATGFAVIAAAALLSSLPPSVHAQPVWPFTLRFSLTTIAEDDDFRREVIAATFTLGGAAALLLWAIILQRWRRWAAIGLASLLIGLATPHFGLLLVEAYPTSYATSPTGFAAASIVQGAALFQPHCAACHGADGAGHGPTTAAIPPADLTADHLWMHSDGELFWWLSHGIEGPDGRLVMPGFAAALTEAERWSLIDAIRAHNAGVKRATTGVWAIPVQAPGFQAMCDGRPVALSDLRGKIVRLLIGAAPAAAPAAATTIATAPPGQARSPVCVASDATVPAAYAIIAGIAADELPGTQFLIDGGGWLRGVRRSDAVASWNDPAVLAAAIRTIEDHPIDAAHPAAMKMQM